MPVLLAGAYGLAAVVVHACWCRLPPAWSSVAKMIAAGAIVGAALIVHLLSAFGLTVASLAGVLSYGLLIELYLFFSTLIFSSVSATWLRRLRRGRADLDEIRALYSPAWMVQTRLERLRANGFIAPTADDRLVVTAKGRRMIRTFGRLRRFFGHGRR